MDNSMVSIKKNWDDKYVLSEVDGLLNNFDDGELFVEEVFSENEYKLNKNRTRERQTRQNTTTKKT